MCLELAVVTRWSVLALTLLHVYKGAPSSPVNDILDQSLGCPVQPPCYCNRPRRGGGNHYGNVQRISCGTLSRKRFPRFIESNEIVEHLSLTYSGLSSIPERAFTALKIIELDLQGNNFGNRISSRAFAGINKELLSINLQWSNITKVPAKLFRGMTSLRNLSLAENRIKRIARHVFYDLKNLEVLSLAGNEITNLPSNIFRRQTKLKLLDLGYCKLERLKWKTLVGLWSLESLDLRGNRLTELLPYTFTDLQSLNTLLLNHNRLTKLTAKVFSGLKNVRVLKLEESVLEYIEPSVFQDTGNVEVLDLGDNKLSFLQTGTLFLPRLQWLSLDGNAFTDVPYEISYLQSLRYLDISYNKLQTIDRCFLVNHDRLEFLNLRENPFMCDCSLVWLRGVKNKLISKWHDKRQSIPFVPGKCWMPINLRGIPITNWIDLECFRKQKRYNEKCYNWSQ